MFVAIENGADTFDCVSPSRVARNAAIYSRDRPVQHHRRPVPPRLHTASTTNATATPAPTTPAPTSTTCSRPRKCSPSTLCTIHNERFIVKLVDDIRASIEGGYFHEFKAETLGRFYGPDKP